MKNRFKLPLMFLAAAALFVGPASAQDLKIATVDVEAVFRGYHRTAKEEARILVEEGRIKKEFEGSMGVLRDLETQVEDLRKKIEDPTISEKVRAEAKKTFLEKVNEGRALEQERKDSHQRRRTALTTQLQASVQEIRAEIIKLITDHSKTEDYDYVFDKSGVSKNQLPFLIYTKGSVDMTEAILAELNKDAPVEAESK